MGARIEAVSVIRSPEGLRRRGAIALSDQAALACLERAGRTARDLDFLVNAGIYRDHHVGEPAVAAIIQEDIDANPDPPVQGGHGTFSFDVINGPCGVLTGMQILDGFLSSGAIGLGMVVAADAPPEGRDRGAFPFAPVGGAVLLAPSDGSEDGFVSFDSVTFPEHAALFESTLEWETHHPGRLAERIPILRGHHTLHIEQREGYVEACLDSAVRAAHDFLATVELRPQEIDLLVTSPGPGELPAELARRLEVPAERLARVDDAFARAHTAGPVAVLDAAMRSGRMDQARNVLLVTVGAGITVATALYRPAPPPAPRARR